MPNLFWLISHNYLPRIKCIETSLSAGVFSLHIQCPAFGGFEDNQARQNQPWVHSPGLAPRFENSDEYDEYDDLPF